MRNGFYALITDGGKIVCAFFFLICRSSGYSFQLNESPTKEDSAAVNLLRKYTYKIQFSGDSIEGEGRDYLLKKVNASQFVLVGEQHGLMESSVLCKYLLNWSSRNSNPFRALATENGPITTASIANLYQSKGKKEALDKIAKYPRGVAFLAYHEDLAMMDPFLNRVDDSEYLKDFIWGIDQEYVGSIRWLLADIKPKIKNKDLRKSVEEIEKEALKASNASDQSSFLLIEPTRENKEKLSELKELYSNEESEVQEVIDAICDSWEIYHDAGGTLRVKYIKQKFIHDYQNLLIRYPSPRVLVKMGSAHTGRGYNFLNMLDLGNYLAEKSVENKSTSCHIQVLTLTGQYNDYLKYTTDAVTYNYWNDLPPRLKFFFQSFIKPGSAESTLIDVSRLRPFTNIVKKLPEELSRIVLTHDLLLLVQNARPATLIVPKH